MLRIILKKTFIEGISREKNGTRMKPNDFTNPALL